MAALFITEERLQFFDMTRPYMDLGFDVLLAKEGAPEALFDFFQPFDLQLWLALLGCTFVCAGVISCCSYLSPYGYRGRYIQRRNKSNDTYADSRNELSLNNSIWFSMTSFLTQVNDNSTERSSCSIQSYAHSSTHSYSILRVLRSNLCRHQVELWLASGLVSAPSL